ncbi:MAG: hypothetical protein HY001_00025 [Candidatus Portnoybacteria bacterium]|nr:hypothetical protein [Candidatus Portnoybacteria bacterium]
MEQEKSKNNKGFIGLVILAIVIGVGVLLLLGQTVLKIDRKLSCLYAMNEYIVARQLPFDTWDKEQVLVLAKKVDFLCDGSYIVWGVR